MATEADLIAAMTSKGHTTETAKAAIAGRGFADLAREYLGGGGSPATSPQLTAENMGGYLDSYQGNLLGFLTGGGPTKTSYTTDELAAALVQKGGYNEVDARNAAENKGGRADELAREFLGVGQDGAGSFTEQFSQIKSALTGGLEYPEPINRSQRFEELRGEYGIADLETQLNDLKAQEEEAYAQLRTNVAAERGKPVAQNVIEGRISQHEQQAREDVEFIQRQINRVVDEINTAYNVVSLYMQFEEADYQDAVARYESEFNQNLQVINLMRGLRQDQITEQQRQIDNARANLQVFTNAITSGNLTYESLSSDQKLLINKLEAQSGLPVGFTSSLQLDPQSRVVFTTSNEGITQVGIMDATGNVTVKSYGTRIGGSGKAKESDAIAAMQSKLVELGGGDYLISPNEWKQQRLIWQQAGYDVGKFDSAFKDTFVDWSHPQDYGFREEDVRL